MQDDLRSAILHDIVTKPYRVPDKKSPIKVDVDGRPDGMAAMMSRPGIIDKYSALDWSLRYRISLVDGNKLVPERGEEKMILRRLENRYGYRWNDSELMVGDKDLHSMVEDLLTDEDLPTYNESPFRGYQHTSLKYHTILVLNLVWNILQGREFKDVRFRIAPRGEGESFERIFIGADFEMLISDRGISLGAPMSNFGQVLSRCPNVIPVDDAVLANAMRLKSWSAGLQYIEDASARS